MKKILVTGGAGYIGSHIVKCLGEKGYDVVVYDNLSKGHRAAVLYGTLLVGDLANTSLLNQVIQDFKPDAVMHFAASIEVGESVKKPVQYYHNNTANTINLLDVLLRHDIHNFIFSSTAAVYGNPENVPVTEDAGIKPINPYGQAKAFAEKVMEDISASGSFRYVALRYFNAAGADPRGRIGERHDPESHLIPLVLKTAKGEQEAIKVYGSDYPTPDGTCIRDYIHVEDLADAHLLALEYLRESGMSNVFNCGYGHGYSVKQVIDEAKKVTGTDFKVEHAGRRAGDPPILVADNSKIKKTLNWTPRYDSLEYIVKTAWEWERKVGETRAE